MPNGCTLTFEPFRATSVHEPLGLTPGDIYGQSTEAIDVGDGVCKHLIARPTYAETGDIVAMSCHCPDGSTITAEPTWNEYGDTVWREVTVEATYTTTRCHDLVLPTFLKLTVPCVLDTGEHLAGPTTWPGAPEIIMPVVSCEPGVSGRGSASYQTTDQWNGSGSQFTVIALSGGILIGIGFAYVLPSRERLSARIASLQVEPEDLAEFLQTPLELNEASSVVRQLHPFPTLEAVPDPTSHQLGTNCSVGSNLSPGLTWSASEDAGCVFVCEDNATGDG